MTINKKKPYHHGDLRNTLIKTGLKILSKDGANALSLRKVAKKAKVSHAAPYRHFCDKETLIAAIAEEGFRKLSKRMEEYAATIPDKPDDPFDKLVKLGRAYIQFALDNPDHYQVMFGGFIEKKDAYPELKSTSEKSFEQFVNIVQTFQNNGYIVNDNPIQLAMCIFSMVHGLAMLLIEKKIDPVEFEFTTIDQIVHKSIKVLYDGLKMG